MIKRVGIVLFLSFLITQMAAASQVEIVNVMIEPAANRWTFHVSLKHEDTGWDHFADDWRIVDEKGKVLGDRKLWHPHEDEQPFTRSLANVLIPKGTEIIYIEAHCKKDGWSKQRVRIDMRQDKGARYEISRP